MSVGWITDGFAQIDRQLFLGVGGRLVSAVVEKLDISTCPRFAAQCSGVFSPCRWKRSVDGSR